MKKDVYHSSEIRHLIIIEDSYTKRTIYLNQNFYSLGRNASNSIVIYSQLVSRHHAYLIKNQNFNDQEDVYQIFDGDIQGNRSSNGIFVNGKYCQSHILTYGDIVVLGGDVKLIYYQFKYYNQNVVLQPHNPTVNLQSKKIIDKTTIQLAQNLEQLNSNLVSQIINRNALPPSEEKYQSIVKQIAEGIFLVDLELKQIIDANDAYCQLLDYSLSEIVNLTIYDVIALNPEQINRNLQSVIEHQKNLIVESQHLQKQGKLVDVEESISLIDFGEQQVLCFAIRNITQRKLAEATLQHQAFHDQLTGLPNRTLFNEHLAKALETAKRNQQLCAVFFLDLDQFKQINDTYGHAVGDQLLQSFANRIEKCLRSSDTLARWGGDEFTILLDRITSAEDAAKISQRIINSLDASFQLLRHQISARVSIGIALYPQDGKDGSTLIKQADAALYRAKSQGRNNYQFYNPQNNIFASETLKLENQLYHALKQQELVLHYQPRIDLNSSKIVAVEALVRWNHPELGLIYPAKFIHIAQQSGLIVEIGEWILQTACAQNRAWQQQGLAPMRIAVNFSAAQFKTSDNYIPNLIQHTLAQTDLPVDLLELEITETAILQNADRTRQILQQLRDIGVYLSWDDFGTGYSSLGYLNQFPFHAIKIDQSAIRVLSDPSQTSAMIEAIIALGKCFNLEIVAEGVENQQQLEYLHSLGCYHIQGYWLSQPMSAQQATTWLIDRAD